MLSDTTIKRLNSLGIIAKQGKRVNGLIRLMENPILWKQAYANIAANKGANTKGVDNVTLDGFSEKRINALVASIKEGTYSCKPVRRTYIPKKNGKKRPLGIPNGDDKLIQEVCRIILEQIYEESFSDKSHGFRKGHSCHTALKQVQRTWTGTKWLIVTDIKGFFDNIDHDILISILNKKIDDTRFIKLIKNMLKAGYIEDWQYGKTYSGTPQGGIISPILANIYLNELDSYMDKLISSFNRGKERALNPDYDKVRGRIRNLHNRIKRVLARKESLKDKYIELEMYNNQREEIRKKGGANTAEWRYYYNKTKTLKHQIEKIEFEASEDEIQRMKNEIEMLRDEMHSLPYGDPYDKNYKRLNYCRYADDFIIGVIGSKEDAKNIKATVEGFISSNLNLEIEENKTSIVKADKGIDFLGFEIQAYAKPVPSPAFINGRSTTIRSNGRIQLIIPNTKLNAFCIKNGYGDMYRHKPTTRSYLTCHSDAEIIETYNSELRGLVNYYSIGNSAHRKLEPVVSLARTSCAITLAHKHRTTTSKIIKSMHRADGEWVRNVKSEKGEKEYKLYRLKTDDKTSKTMNWDMNILPNTAMFSLSYTELVRRLDAEVCEVCGSTENVEVHHIRALKDIKNSKSLYDQMMIARKRKTLILCSKCHHKLHAGK